MTTPRDNASEPRSAQWEIEVPATPEQVWEAIATGPGITAWFIPADVEEREGGTIVLGHGQPEHSTGVVTAWEPPRRFAYEEEWQPPGTDAPVRLATELLVETRAGGTCVVRLVSSGFGHGDAWDDVLESMDRGWQAFLENLRLYLAHFAGLRCSTMSATGSAAGSEAESWRALLDALGLEAAPPGERTSATAPDAPALAGVVERATATELLLHVDEPTSGHVLLSVYTWGGGVYTMLQAYLFGDEAPAIAARDEPAWKAWMEERFPAAAEVPSA